jgi:PAS domain S-box-containing protein
MSEQYHDPAIPEDAAGTVDVVTKVRREEALLKAGALQSAIFNSANFSSIATDAKGVIQIFNVGAERMLGYTAIEVVDKITPADISDPREVIARAKALSIELATPITPGFEALVFKASRGIEDIYELTYIRKDGSRFPAVVSVTALRDDLGGIIGYLLIGTDNTARKQAEEALLKAGALQNAIFNSENFSSIATDAKGVIQIFNVGAERMLGYAAIEVVDKITPADISDPREVIARAKVLSLELATPITPGFEALVFKASRGIEDIYELTYIRKDGSRFPAVVSVTALRDDLGGIIGYLLIGTDNTARKQAQAEQKQLDQRLRDQQFYTRSLIESNIDALMATDPAGIITDVNKQMEALTGCTRDELIGAPFKNYFTDPERAEAGIMRVLSGSKVTDYELTVRARDGKETVVSFNATTFHDRDRKLLGVFAAARDVTEHKELEERLRQSQKMDAIGRLAGGVAHDFNNLLTVINGYSDLLLGKLDTRDPMREEITQILNAGKLAAKLTQQLLAFSRRQVLQPKVLDLNHLVLDVEKMLRRLVGEDIEIVTVLSPQAELVMADPGQMTQVLMNLAVNARDAMPSSGHLVIETAHLDLDQNSVKEHPEVEPGPYVQLTISDSGIGMDEATKSHIFEPFFTTKKSGQSTGLGLATVYGIVKQAGGSIWVYSEPGKGTTFKVYLPQVNEGIPIQESKPEIESLRGDETILVVEDQADIRKLAQQILEGYGYQVLTAANGGEALLQAERHVGPIQLMLTDVVMPRMTGRELADRLKPLRPAMKVLYMSGYTDNVVVHRGIVDLGVAYLQKPFTPVGLAAKVREVLVRPAVTILVVDDEAVIRGLLRHFLKAAGYEVLEAADGRQAVTQAETHHVDLMITDLIMLEQEGIETIRLLHKQQPNLKIIGMSGAMNNVYLDLASRLGAQATLAKPFNKENVLETVHRVLAP